MRFARSENQWAKVWSMALLIVVLSLSSVPGFAQEGRKALIHPQPAYPELAKELSLKGTVRVEVVIGADGEIKSTKVLGGHPILAQASVDALRKWKYAAASTETTTVLEFTFHQ
jgi:TonB family protein